MFFIYWICVLWPLASCGLVKLRHSISSPFSVLTKQIVCFGRRRLPYRKRPSNSFHRIVIQRIYFVFKDQARLWWVSWRLHFLMLLISLSRCILFLRGSGDTIFFSFPTLSICLLVSILICFQTEVEKSADAKQRGFHQVPFFIPQKPFESWYIWCMVHVIKAF